MKEIEDRSPRVKPMDRNKKILVNALKKIARGETSDTSSNPLTNSQRVAYLALGGRVENGKLIDKDLLK